VSAGKRLQNALSHSQGRSVAQAAELRSLEESLLAAQTAQPRLETALLQARLRFEAREAELAAALMEAEAARRGKHKARRRIVRFEDEATNV
jgi:hypothetical protein